MKKFYRNILGLSLHSDHGNFIAFNIGTSRLNIGLHDKVGGNNSDPFRIMINLGTTNILLEAEDLRKHNVKVIRPKNTDGLNQIFTRDISFVIENKFIISNINIVKMITVFKNRKFFYKVKKFRFRNFHKISIL